MHINNTIYKLTWPSKLCSFVQIYKYYNSVQLSRDGYNEAQCGAVHSCFILLYILYIISCGKQLSAPPCPSVRPSVRPSHLSKLLLIWLKTNESES